MSDKAGMKLYKLVSDAGKLKARYHSVMSSATELVGTIRNPTMTQWAWARNDENVGMLIKLHGDLAAKIQADTFATEFWTSTAGQLRKTWGTQHLQENVAAFMRYGDVIKEVANMHEVLILRCSQGGGEKRTK